MKKRIFYVVNLDRRRILILAGLFFGLMMFAFATGFRVGGARASILADSRSERERDVMLLAPEEEGNDAGEVNDAEDPGDAENGESAEERQSDSDPAARRNTERRSETRERDITRREQSAPPPRNQSNTTSEARESRSAPPERSAQRTTDSSERRRQAPVLGGGSDASSSTTALTNVATTASADRNETETAAPAPRSESVYTYTLQAGAFSRRGPADRLAAALKSQGFDARVASAGGHWVVRLGQASGRRELYSLQRQLQERDYDTIMKRY